MMDDPELIIYILFLAVSLIGGVWKNYKKGQARKLNPEQVDETVVEGDLEEMFEQQRREQELARSIELEERRLEQEKLIQIPVPEPTEMVSFDRKETAIRQERKVRTRILTEPTEEETTTTEMNLEDFDARKAIIYSEILNPPYL